MNLSQWYFLSPYLKVRDTHIHLHHAQHAVLLPKGHRALLLLHQTLVPHSMTHTHCHILHAHMHCNLMLLTTIMHTLSPPTYSSNAASILRPQCVCARHIAHHLSPHPSKHICSHKRRIPNPAPHLVVHARIH